MAATQALLETHLPPVLATLVHSFFRPQVTKDAAFLGHWELSQEITDVNDGLYGACCGGHRELVDLMIARGANDGDSGLYGACRGGHRELVDLMIARGANDWNSGLWAACINGHRELVDLMIARGATQ